ncbi:MAG: zinc-binding dehydrogenase [Candidatus Auribacterota bacterium]|nr:zinc-binding dehydrogenase [Candidatus Auribacterota bacterium]
MKACFIQEFGDISVLQVGYLDDPQPKPDEVVIELKAAALNHLDIWVRLGRPGKNLPMPHILGSDGSGIVRSVGSACAGINVGDEVVINPSLPCEKCRACRSGQQSECDSFGILGLTKHGTFAGLVSVAASRVYPKPAHMTFTEAAAFPLTFLTAWRMLMTKGKVTAGQKILIHGIGGGVAQAALQLSILAGAETIVTSSCGEKLAKARLLGAHHVISYTEQNVVEQVLRISGKNGVDVIIDAVGAKTMLSNPDMVRKGGRIVLCGVTTGATAEINLQAIYWKQIQVLGSTMGSDNEFRQMLDAITVNKLKPVIDSVYPLDEIQVATGRMEAGDQFGKLALTIG